MRVVGECFFWYRLTRVFPDKFHRAVKWLCVVCVCVSLSLPAFLLVVCLCTFFISTPFYADRFHIRQCTSIAIVYLEFSISWIALFSSFLVDVHFVLFAY